LNSLSEAASKTALNQDTGLIKIVAVITMIDHIGASFFPQVIILRVIGRIAFPIFAYCIVVGCLYTRDIRKYLLRLLVFAIISQPVYVLNVFGRFEYWFYLNIMFTLLFGAFAVYSLMDFRRRWWLLLPCIAACVFLHLEYGTYGIILIVAFYMLREKLWLSAVVLTLILALPAIRFVNGVIKLNYQGFAVLAAPFIYARTDTKLRLNKYFFYVFYPAHLWVIFAVGRVLK